MLAHASVVPVSVTSHLANRDSGPVSILVVNICQVTQNSRIVCHTATGIWIMFKRLIRLVTAGSIGLMIGSHALSAGLFDRDNEERTKVSPACHPTFGYHQTCWRQFSPLPPCHSCNTCQDGSCETPLYQPQLTGPLTHPGPVFPADIHSGRYHNGHSAMSGAIPPGGSQVMSTHGPIPIQTPQPVIGERSGSKHYGQGSSTPDNGIPSPMSAPSLAPPGHGVSPPLPPVPGPADHQSTPRFLPSRASIQPQTVTGYGRYGIPARAVSASVQPAMPQRGYQTRTTPRSNRYRSVSQPRYPALSNQPAHSRVRATTTQLTQPVTAPFLKLPVDQTPGL